MKIFIDDLALQGLTAAELEFGGANASRRPGAGRASSGRIWTGSEIPLPY